MKLLVAGDTHRDIIHINYLLTTAEEIGAEKVFVVGDFGAWEHFDFGVEFFDDCDALARNLGVLLYFLDGNHDKTSLVLKYYDKPGMTDHEGFLMCREHVRYAKRGHRWNWDDVSFISLGGAYSTDKAYRLAQEAHEAADLFDMICKYAPPSHIDLEVIKENFSESSWFPEEEMTDADLEQILAHDKSPVDIMLTHDKPRSANPDFNRKDIEACYHNQDRIQRAVLALQPRRLIHGHLHYRYTDQIMCGDDNLYTVVDGLDCNTKHARHIKVNGKSVKPDPENSWILLDLPTERWMSKHRVEPEG